MLQCNPAETPAETGLVMGKDESEDAVDPTYFKQIVGSLWYLCNSIPDLAFSVGFDQSISGESKKFSFAGF